MLLNSSGHCSFFIEISFYIHSFSFQVLVAVLPQAQMQYFDVEAKTWKPFASTIPPIEAHHFYCGVSIGRNLFVAGVDTANRQSVYRYDTEGLVWEKQPHSCGVISNLSILEDFMYAIGPYPADQVPQRYNFATRQWQSIATVGTQDSHYLACNSVAIVHSKVLVLYGNTLQRSAGLWHPAVLNCFDPVKNEWEVKETTCHPHFGSSLFVVNSRLYVAGGYVSTGTNGIPAPVEVYDEENNTWSVVEQKHIPSNNLGAVEIEGRVYFTVNKFPIDSGIRIPPGELYPVPLGEWNNLGTIGQNAVLCYLPVKRESLKTE